MRICSSVSRCSTSSYSTPSVGERAGRVETERLEVAGQHFHRRDAARFNRLDELATRRKRKIVAAPQPEPLRIGEIVDRGGPGRRNIDNARIRQSVLQTQTSAALLRGSLVAPFTFAARGVLHRVRLVKNDDAVEIGAQPFHDLLDSRYLLVTRVGP